MHIPTSKSLPCIHTYQYMYTYQYVSNIQWIFTYTYTRHICVHTYQCMSDKNTYGVATMSRLFKIIGLFRKRALQKRGYSAKETHYSKEPTNRSHPIPICAFGNVLRSLLIVATPYQYKHVEMYVCIYILFTHEYVHTGLIHMV